MMNRGFFKPIILLAFVAVAGVVVMLLWNCIVPTVIGWGALNYLQAIGLFMLCRVLFGGFSGIRERARISMMDNCRRDEIIDQIKSMSPEQRREHIRRYRHNCMKNEQQ